MEGKSIEAYFATEDDAYSASIHLQAMDGVSDIFTDHIPNEDDEQGQIIFPFMPGQGQSVSSTTMGIPFFSYFMGNDVDEEEGDGIGRRVGGKKGNYMLTCTVEADKLHEVIEAILRSGGSVEVV